jgi:hypothetical protein
MPNSMRIDSMRAFADGDYELARTLKQKDTELDALTRDSRKVYSKRFLLTVNTANGYLFTANVSREGR